MVLGVACEKILDLSLPLTYIQNLWGEIELICPISIVHWGSQRQNLFQEKGL
jgi:hypothetical protein